MGRTRSSRSLRTGTTSDSSARRGSIWPWAASCGHRTEATRNTTRPPTTSASCDPPSCTMPSSSAARCSRSWKPTEPISTRTRSASPSSASVASTGHWRSEEHTSELQSLRNLVCRLLLEKKKKYDLSLRSSRSSYFATLRHQLTILSKTYALDEEKWLNMLETIVKDEFRYE